ncbi:MAG: ABC-F family ATP-binding cassette domain-containing protein [Verrucomicrobiales bacterium]
MSSPGPALVSAKDLMLSFGNRRVLEGATLAVSEGEKVGFVGRNGVGKTCLLRILGGVDRPDSGEVSRRRDLRIGWLPQESVLDDSATVRGNVEAGAADLVEWLRSYEQDDLSATEQGDLLHKIEHADGWTLAERITSTLNHLSAPSPDAVVGTLSGGENRRVALARALVGQPDLLVLDEPTNHLDAESIEWLEDFLRGYPGAVAFVTHDRYFLDKLAQRIIEVDQGKCISHAGNYTAYLESKAQRQSIAEQTERRRQRFLRSELEWVRAGVRARRTKSKFRIASYYAVEGLEAPPEEREMDLLIPPPPALGNTIVDHKNVGARFGDRWLFRGLDFAFLPGECVGVLGRNGVGKTTLLRLCLGLREPDEGTITIGKRTTFNYIDQGRVELDDSKGVLDEIKDQEEIVFFGGQRISARGYLRRFLFTDDRINDRVGSLSGGERGRLMLAKVLKRGGNFIVLDEPTNDLDLNTLRILEEGIAGFGGCALVVSHDRYFLDRVCDRVIAFEEDGLFIQPGNFSYYMEKRKQRLANQPVATSGHDGATTAAVVASETARATATPVAKTRKLTYKEERELESMEAVILAAEQKAAAMEAQLINPEFYRDHYAELDALASQLAEQKKSIAASYARWEELAAAKGT